MKGAEDSGGRSEGRGKDGGSEQKRRDMERAEKEEEMRKEAEASDNVW